MSIQANKDLIIKLNKIFAEGDVETFLSYCAEDVKWAMVGHTPMIGKEQVRKGMEIDEFPDPPQINLRTVIAEQDMVMAEGSMSMKRKGGNMYNAFFCDIYKLKDGKIQELNSYVIEQKLK